MIITRRAFTVALSMTGLAALAGFSPLRGSAYVLRLKQQAKRFWAFLKSAQ